MMANEKPRKSALRLAVRWTLRGLVAIVVAAIVWAIIDAGIGIARFPELVEHVPASHTSLRLPADATDVCYVKRAFHAPFNAFEFNTSETSFVAWAKANNYDPIEISQPYSLHRYNRKDVTVVEGLFYEKIFDPDTGLHLAYDRRAKRAYYLFQNH